GVRHGASLELQRTRTPRGGPGGREAGALGPAARNTGRRFADRHVVLGRIFRQSGAEKIGRGDLKIGQYETKSPQGVKPYSLDGLMSDPSRLWVSLKHRPPKGKTNPRTGLKTGHYRSKAKSTVRSDYATGWCGA